MQSKSSKNESAKKVQDEDNAHNSEMKEALDIQISESMKKGKDAAFLQAQKEAEERGFEVFIYADWLYLKTDDVSYKIEYNQEKKTLLLVFKNIEFKTMIELIDFLFV